MLTSSLARRTLRLPRLARGLAHSRPKLPLVYSEEVLDALESGKPVIALESTIITHGMPKPVNLKTAESLESIIRSSDAVPAHIALLGGVPHIGLTSAQLSHLALEAKDVVKTSRRDLPGVMALKKDGGTTVAGTMLLAQEAGVKVFVTGGIGGVHRGGERTWDVSADLTELGRTNVSVICAGAKSILDTGRTLEYLETQGVTVATIGDSPDFPAFYSPSSGFQSPLHLLTPELAAAVTFAARPLSSGQLYCVPIPATHHAAGAEIQRAVEQAVRESEENGIAARGKEVTPWLLARVGELTKGQALQNNIALIENNARVGGRLAVELARLEQEEKAKEQEDARRLYPSASPFGPRGFPPRARAPPRFSPPTRIAPSEDADATSAEEHPRARLVIVGAAAIDITSTPSVALPSELTETTHPGRVQISAGGVARNMAEAAHRVLRQTGRPPILVSPIGKDAFAGVVRRDMEERGMRTDGLIDGYTATPVVSLMLDHKGSLREGVADFRAVEELQAEKVLEVVKKHDPRVIAFDGNIGPGAIEELLRHAHSNDIETFFEPTSVPKSLSIIPALTSLLHSASPTRPPLTHISPNLLELTALASAARSSGLTDLPAHWAALDALSITPAFRSQVDHCLSSGGDCGSWMTDSGLVQMAVQLLPAVGSVWVKCGERGVVFVGRFEEGKSWEGEQSGREKRQVVHRAGDGVVVVKHFPALKIDEGGIKNTTGAGDSFSGALLAALSLAGVHDRERLEKVVALAQDAAVLTLGSDSAVSPRINFLSEGVA